MPAIKAGSQAAHDRAMKAAATRKAVRDRKRFTYTVYVQIEGDSSWHAITDVRGSQQKAREQANDAIIARDRYGNHSPVKHIKIVPYGAPAPTSKPAKPARATHKASKAAKKKTENKEPKRESMTMGVRRSRESPYHTPPQYIEHWEAAISQAKGNMARPKRELPVLKSELKHFQRLAKEYPDNDYYPVAIASNRRQIAGHLDRIRAEQDQLRYLAKHKPTAYHDKARYMREKRARERRDK